MKVIWEYCINPFLQKRKFIFRNGCCRESAIANFESAMGFFEGIPMGRKKCFKTLIFWMLIVGIFLIGCAGMQPPVQRVSEAQFERGLTISEQEFKKPIDILQGEWNPQDLSTAQVETKKHQEHGQGNYFIQILSVSTKEQARQFVEKIKKSQPDAEYFVRKRGKFWAVWVGRFQNRKMAKKALISIWSKRFHDAWIVRGK